MADLVTMEKLELLKASHKTGCSSTCHSFEELASTIEHLWKENSKLEAERSSHAYDVLVPVEEWDDLKERTSELEARNRKLEAACQEFVRKVECGEARSVRSYKQMRDGSIPAGEREGGVMDWGRVLHFFGAIFFSILGLVSSACVLSHNRKLEIVGLCLVLIYVPGIELCLCRVFKK